MCDIYRKVERERAYTDWLCIGIQSLLAKAMQLHNVYTEAIPVKTYSVPMQRE